MPKGRLFFSLGVCRFDSVPEVQRFPSDDSRYNRQEPGGTLILQPS